MNSYNAGNAYSKLLSYGVSLDSAWSYEEMERLRSIIDDALAVPSPDGNPSVISEIANAYMQAGSTLMNGVSADLSDAANNKLPAAWSGDAAETAQQEVSSLATLSSNAGGAIYNAGQALEKWADDLQQAQKNDASGRASLKSASQVLDALPVTTPSIPDLDSFGSAVVQAQNGLSSMSDGALGASMYGVNAVYSLQQSAGQAVLPTTVASSKYDASQLVAG